jgi:hypothetical protein
VSRSTCQYREADACWEETSTCTSRKPRGMGPGDLAWVTGNNVGMDHPPAGIGDNLQGRSGIGQRSRCEGFGSAHGAFR